MTQAASLLALQDLDIEIMRAKKRLDKLDFYPRPVDVSRVRIFTTPWLFRIPGFRRFTGYEFGPPSGRSVGECIPRPGAP